MRGRGGAERVEREGLHGARVDAGVSAISDIEAAVVEHWSLLGLWPGAELVDEGGILRFETPIPALP